MKDNEWAMSKYPFVPGHEVVGTLLAHGSEVSLKNGLKQWREFPCTRLGVGWIRNSCRRCYACLKGQENVCAEGYEGTILNGNFGGFQSVIRVPADFAYKIPDGLSSDAAAPLLCAGITVYAPLKRFMTAGQRIGVLGIGGLGHLAIQFASKMGGNVAAMDLGRAKEKEVRRHVPEGFETPSICLTEDGQRCLAGLPQVMDLGAHMLVDMTKKEDWQSYTGANGFDVIINCSSANVDTGLLLSMLRNDGTLIQVHSTMACITGCPTLTTLLQSPCFEQVFGQKKVAGSIVGGRADMDAMLQLAATHGIAPYIETLPFSKVNEALEKVAKGQAHYRVVLTLSDEA
ncbi:chaperonin 10-like protein [Dunaliella salina]|uniref:Chaperonin 10-like protein n=1 Tax=Dunaliella salina TaxID=3046 RepID=A0ABQ7H1X8_DUNSA|nr:chaperonin 10-like protein [Dunaliella salina]|eukprot:KAF5840868.1 chaperonin 10-like protein [Dunaliella salina]